MSNSTQLKELHDVFQLCSKSGVDAIDRSQVALCLRLAGLNPSKAIVRKYTRFWAPTAGITFAEFLLIYEKICKRPCTQKAQDYIGFLQRYDTDGKGYLPAAQLKRLLTSAGERFSEREADQMLAQFLDEQGNVNYMEFVKMIVSM